jgi:hypothetical protein
MVFMRTGSVLMNCKPNIKMLHHMSKYLIASHNKSLLHEIPVFSDKTTCGLTDRIRRFRGTCSHCLKHRRMKRWTSL